MIIQTTQLTLAEKVIESGILENFRILVLFFDVPRKTFDLSKTSRVREIKAYTDLKTIYYSTVL